MGKDDMQVTETLNEGLKRGYAITVTGCPAISVPAGFTASGLPIGFQIVGPRWQDFAVLQLAHAFETLSDAGRRRPSSAHM